MFIFSNSTNHTSLQDSKDTFTLGIKKKYFTSNTYDNPVVLTITQ